MTGSKPNSAVIATPLGDLSIYATVDGLTEIAFAGIAPDRELARQTLADALLPTDTAPSTIELRYLHSDHPQIEQHLSGAVKQLSEYFQGQRREFQLVLAPQGTKFQQQVWQLLRQIPYGQTWSYGEQANQLGNANASRAVGAANGKNPLAIVVPCHRVIAANQRLTGYAGGLSRKLWLLRFEQSFDRNE